VKAPKASSEADKLVFLKKRESQIRTVSRARQWDLLRRLAAQMRSAGLYSEKTIIVDIANGLHKRCLKWGWISRDKVAHRVPRV
jgi:hypothetical protein